MSDGDMKAMAEIVRDVERLRAKVEEFKAEVRRLLARVEELGRAPEPRGVNGLDPRYFS